MKIQNYENGGMPSANSVRFISDSSTLVAREDLTISRKAPVYNSSTKQYSIPEYRLVYRKDIALEGVPTGQRLTVDMNIRMPIGTTQEELEKGLQDIAALTDHEDFVSYVVRQLFPCVACTESDEE